MYSKIPSRWIIIPFVAGIVFLYHQHFVEFPKLSSRYSSAASGSLLSHLAAFGVLSLLNCNSLVNRDLILINCFLAETVREFIKRHLSKYTTTLYITIVSTDPFSSDLVKAFHFIQIDIKL